MYSDAVKSRLQSLISSSGGIEKAALRLKVFPSTLEKILCDRKISKPTELKIEAVLGPVSRGQSQSQGSRLSTAQAKDATELLSDLQSLIKESGGLDEASIRLGVRPTTLEKLLSGKQISAVSRQRIRDRFEKARSSREPISFPTSLVQRLSSVHVLYTTLGTLEAVGKEIGLTRQRVRQLLAKGSRLGLFEYKPYKYPYVAKEKLLADYASTLSLARVAHINGLSASSLSKLLTAYGITQKDLNTYKSNTRRMQCLEHYRRLMTTLGHHPTATELQAGPEGHYLYTRIKRLWGSIDAFRQELNIPKPAQGSSSFREDTSAWREHLRRLGIIARMQHIDRIRDCLETSGKLSASELKYECRKLSTRMRHSRA